MKILNMVADDGVALGTIEEQLQALDATIELYQKLLTQAQEMRRKIENQTIPVPQAGDTFHAVVDDKTDGIKLVAVRMVEKDSKT